MKAESQLDLPYIRWRKTQMNLAAVKAAQILGDQQGGAAVRLKSVVAQARKTMQTSGVEQVETLILCGEEEWERGAWFEAETSLRQAISRVKAERLPKVWQGLACAMLAELSEAQHRGSEAVQLYLTATEIMEENECHPWAELRYKCHNNLGCLLKRAEQAEKSELSFIRAIKVLETDSPTQWEDRSVLYHNMGALYHENGHYAEAVEMHRQALGHLNQLAEIPTDFHAEVSRALAVGLLFTGNQEEALANLSIARKMLGTDSLETAATMTELLVMEASIRLQRNDLAGAETFCLEAIELCQKYSAPRPTGSTAQMLPMLYTNLACVYAQAGSLESSREMFEDAHLLLLGMWNTSDEALRDSHHNLLLINQKLNDQEGVLLHEAKLRRLDNRLNIARRKPVTTDSLVSHQPIARKSADGVQLSFGLGT